jgi:hypothetical protein
LATGFAVFGLFTHGVSHPHLDLPRGIGKERGASQGAVSIDAR